MNATPFCIIRGATGADLPLLRQIYRHAVVAIAAQRYTPQQVVAWANTANNRTRFEHWIQNSTTLVAVNPEDIPVGFASLKTGGRIAALYVDPRWMRKGVATRLVRELISLAASRGCKMLTSEASEFSKPVFEHQGFVLEHTEQVMLHDVEFRRYVMLKSV